MKPFPKIIYAPLAGCSDFPFRKMSARYCPGLMFCEMVKMEALMRKVPSTYQMLEYEDDMRPIGGQICGSNPALAGPCAKIIEDLGFDSVDLNCGCPVDKITKDGSGSGMLKDPEKIGEMISNMVAAVNIPVTVKIRAGWDEESIYAPWITEIAEAAGAEAIFVHGRTRQQAYRGPAKWDHIRACKQVANQIKVVGNGDVFSAEAAQRMFEETGCDAVLVSRGTMGQPWIAEDIRRILSHQPPINRTFEECLQALLDHLFLSKKYKTEQGALIDARKVCCWYLKDAPGVRELRKKVSHATTFEEIIEFITSFECSTNNSMSFSTAGFKE